MKNATDKKMEMKDPLSYLLDSIKESPEAILSYKLDRIRIQISESLKRFREISAMSQEDLAKKMNVNQSWISKIESPNYDHGIETIAQYLFAFDAEINISTSLHGRTFGIADSKYCNSLEISEAELPSFLSLGTGPGKLPKSKFWEHPNGEGDLLGPTSADEDPQKWWRKHAA